MSTPPQRPDHRPPNSGSWLSITLALIAFSMCAAALVLVSNFFFTPIFVIGAAVFGFTALHYVLWGWWLGRMIQQEGEEDEA